MAQVKKKKQKSLETPIKLCALSISFHYFYFIELIILIYSIFLESSSTFCGTSYYSTFATLTDVETMRRVIIAAVVSIISWVLLLITRKRYGKSRYSEIIKRLYIAELVISIVVVAFLAITVKK